MPFGVDCGDMCLSPSDVTDRYHLSEPDSPICDFHFVTFSDFGTKRNFSFYNPYLILLFILRQILFHLILFHFILDFIYLFGRYQ